MLNKFISRLNKKNYNLLNKQISLFTSNKKGFSDTNVQATKRVHGGLKDQDRIFTNVYRDNDPFIEGALKRVKKISHYKI